MPLADLSSFYLDVLKDRLYCVRGRSRRSSQTRAASHRLRPGAAALPGLPFTADEIWPMVPGAGLGPHGRLPREGAPDEALVAHWERMLDVRSTVTKALEVAAPRSASPRAWRRGWKCSGPPPLSRPCASTRTDSAFPNLANLFIVSAARLVDGEGPVSVTVEQALGAKCERCWTYSEEGRALDRSPGRLRGCAEVLAAHDEPRASSPLSLIESSWWRTSSPVKARRALARAARLPIARRRPREPSHVRNRGAAFGILSDADLPYQAILFSALSLCRSSPSASTPGGCRRARLPQTALALILGGAFGNLIDRIRLGYVVDFVHVYWREHQWPDFNVADSAITIGVTLLVLDILRTPHVETPAKAELEAVSPAGRTE
jgi:lipoprotein signal peptidase